MKKKHLKSILSGMVVVYLRLVEDYDDLVIDYGKAREQLDGATTALPEAGGEIQRLRKALADALETCRNRKQEIENLEAQNTALRKQNYALRKVVADGKLSGWKPPELPEIEIDGKSTVADSLLEEPVVKEALDHLMKALEWADDYRSEYFAYWH